MQVSAGTVIERDKEKITFTATGFQTNYQKVELIVEVQPGGCVGPHTHPDLKETFIATQGTLTLTSNEEVIELTPENSEGFTVPAGALHSWQNNTHNLVICKVTFAPKTYYELYHMGERDVAQFLCVMFAMSKDCLFTEKTWNARIQIATTRWAFRSVSGGPSSPIDTVTSLFFALIGYITKVNPVYKSKQNKEE